MIHIDDGLAALSRRYDVLVLGRLGVGKLALIFRYLYGTFHENPPAEEQLYITMVKTAGNEDHHHKVAILDAASATSTYASSRKKQIKNARVMLLTYAADDRSSFEFLELLLYSVRAQCGAAPPFSVAALKLDKFAEQQVLFSEGEQFAARHGAIGFYECLALTNVGVKAVFEPLVERSSEVEKSEGAGAGLEEGHSDRSESESESVPDAVAETESKPDSHNTRLTSDTSLTKSAGTVKSEPKGTRDTCIDRTRSAGQREKHGCCVIV